MNTIITNGLLMVLLSLLTACASSGSGRRAQVIESHRSGYESRTTVQRLSKGDHATGGLLGIGQSSVGRIDPVYNYRYSSNGRQEYTRSENKNAYNRLIVDPSGEVIGTMVTTTSSSYENTRPAPQSFSYGNTREIGSIHSDYISGPPNPFRIFRNK